MREAVSEEAKMLSKNAILTPNTVNLTKVTPTIVWDDLSQ